VPKKPESEGEPTPAPGEPRHSPSVPASCAGDFQALAVRFDGLYNAALLLDVRDAEREYTSLAAQGGRLAQLVGLVAGGLRLPRKDERGDWIVESVEPDPSAPPSVTIPGTRVRTVDFYARAWRALVEVIGHENPARFPDPTPGAEVTHDPDVYRRVPDVDPRAGIRREARVSAIAARIISEHLRASDHGSRGADAGDGNAKPPAALASGPHSSPSGKPKPTRRERRAKWLAEAMLTVRDHPEWSDAAIAARAGINKSRLSRSPEYQAAARMARAPKTPDGSVTMADGDRRVEAVDDSFDANRPASRQSQDEEDTDDRIDREMRETQRKPQRRQSKPP
jgi:hypothetical protein